MYELLDVAKGFLNGGHIEKNSVLVDFTMGNGHDTEYLCSLVPDGKVYAFDIQQSALDNTAKRLSDAGFSNAELILDSHANVKNYVKCGIDGGLFNLGYLPGGDKSIHTMRTSTLPAIKAAIELLNPGCVLVINVYPGHEEGKLEGEMLYGALSEYDKKYYCITNFRIINSHDAPFIFAVEKYRK